MPLSLSQFRRSLIEYGIVSEQDLLAIEDSLADQVIETQAFAEHLVAKKTLTEFQSKALLAGKPNSLVLGNYRLLELLGQGGMGAVYKARHTRMNRDVAIKLLPEQSRRSTSVVARFQREVEAAAKLEHSNIVAAYDADEAGGVHFLVMQYVAGADLLQVVKRDGPLSIGATLDCIRQAAEGLAFAHQEGVIHRDVKPANLLLSDEGIVKLLDMGLARIQLDIETEEFVTEMTASGMIMGTVDFMAPEQANDTRSADERADIYSLGCTMYYLLTGTAMYQERTVLEKILAHREQPPPVLSSVRPETPDAVDAMFQKMVAKNPTDRFQSAKELLTVLNPIYEQHHGENDEAETSEFVASRASTNHQASSSTRVIGKAKSRIQTGFRVIAVAAGLAVILLASLTLAWTLGIFKVAGVANSKQLEPAQPPIEADAPDYASIVNGVWVRPFQANPPRLREGVAFEDGLLELTDSTLTLTNIHGANFVIRAEVLLMSKNISFHMRGNRDTNDGSHAGRFYGGWVNKTYLRRGIGFSGGDGGWEDFVSERPATEPVLVDGYLDIAFAAVDEKLTLYINGKLAAEATDDRLFEGLVQIGVNNGSAKFRNIEIMALDEP